jgi:hypothetical protein
VAHGHFGFDPNDDITIIAAFDPMFEHFDTPFSPLKHTTYRCAELTYIPNTE